MGLLSKSASCVFTFNRLLKASTKGLFSDSLAHLGLELVLLWHVVKGLEGKFVVSIKRDELGLAPGRPTKPFSSIAWA